MILITKELETRFKNVGSQESSSNPLVIAKLFNPCGAGTWYLTEYEPETKIAFGYVTGLAEDEWGYISIEELASMRLTFGLGIERDLSFEPKRFNELELKK